MYNPEEDIVPLELLQQSLNLAVDNSKFKVYFNKDNGDIFAIANEDNPNYQTFIEFDFSVVEPFLTNKQNPALYKLVFKDASTPEIVLKNTDDIPVASLIEIPETEGWSNALTIENIPWEDTWCFQLRNDQNDIIKDYNLNLSIEFYIVDGSNNNFVYRIIKLSLFDLLNNKKVYIRHNNKIERLKSNKIYTRKFFKTYGYYYDPKFEIKNNRARHNISQLRRTKR